MEVELVVINFFEIFCEVFSDGGDQFLVHVLLESLQNHQFVNLILFVEIRQNEEIVGSISYDGPAEVDPV